MMFLWLYLVACLVTRWSGDWCRHSPWYVGSDARWANGRLEAHRRKLLCGLPAGTEYEAIYGEA
jgi:hypothetical protein